MVLFKVGLVVVTEEELEEELIVVVVAEDELRKGLIVVGTNATNALFETVCVTKVVPILKWCVGTRPAIIKECRLLKSSSISFHMIKEMG
jgi:hypothetical protein